MVEPVRDKVPETVEHPVEEGVIVPDAESVEEVVREALVVTVLVEL